MERILKNWIVKKREEKKRADLERLALVIETERDLAHAEADVLEQQLGPNVPLVQCALKLREAFNAWYQKYREVLIAYDEFEAEVARHEASKSAAIVSGEIFRNKQFSAENTPSGK